MPNKTIKGNVPNADLFTTFKMDNAFLLGRILSVSLEHASAELGIVCNVKKATFWTTTEYAQQSTKTVKPTTGKTAIAHLVTKTTN